MIPRLKSCHSIVAAVFISARRRCGARAERRPPEADAGRRRRRAASSPRRCASPSSPSTSRGASTRRSKSTDVLVVEDDVPQQVKSVRRMPASVLLLLGTGGDSTPSMRANTTRDVALCVIETLREGDRVAVIQFNGKTRQRCRAGRPTREAGRARAPKQARLRRAARVCRRPSCARSSCFESEPVGNRHLVLVTDGIEPRRDRSQDRCRLAWTRPSRGAGCRSDAPLIAAQTTLHVISYTEWRARR